MPLPTVTQLMRLSKESLVNELYSLINDPDKMMKVLAEKCKTNDFYIFMIEGREGLYASKNPSHLMSALLSVLHEICQSTGIKFNDMLHHAREKEEESISGETNVGHNI